jgi:hypothetical protein
VLLLLADFQDISGLAISGLKKIGKLTGYSGFKKKIRGLAISGTEKKIAMPTSAYKYLSSLFYKKILKLSINVMPIAAPDKSAKCCYKKSKYMCKKRGSFKSNKQCCGLGLLLDPYTQGWVDPDPDLMTLWIRIRK